MGYTHDRQAANDTHPPAAEDEFVATLREAAERYAAPCPFKPGDLVTPRAGFLYHGAGLPFVVLAVSAFGNVAPDFQSGPSTPLFGARLDVRVAGSLGSGICAWWQESWMLEPYTGPTEVERVYPIGEDGIDWEDHEQSVKALDAGFLPPGHRVEGDALIVSPIGDQPLVVHGIAMARFDEVRTEDGVVLKSRSGYVRPVH